MLEQIFQMIISPELQQALLPLRIIFLLLSGLAIGLIIYFLIRTTYLRFVFLDRWNDYSHWKQHYSYKAIKKAYSSASGPEEFSKLEDEKLNLKDGRIKRSEWERIKDRLKTGEELNYKLALIDADKLFNQALEKRGRKFSPKLVPNTKNVLRAKKVLEEILTHQETKLTLRRAKKNIAIYQKGFSKLKKFDDK